MKVRSDIACNRFLVTFSIVLHCFFGVASLQAKTYEQDGFSLGEKEGWVEPFKVILPKEKPVSESQRYLLVDQQINFLAGSHKRFYRQASEVLTSTGVEEASEIKIIFNADYETVRLHHIRVVRDGVLRDLSSSVTPRFLQQEPDMADAIHTGLTTALFHLPDIRVGDVVDFSYTFSGNNPVFGDKPFGAVDVNWSVSVEHLRVRVLADEVLFFKTHNGHHEIQKKAIPGGTEYRIEDRKTQVVTYEDDYPYGVTPYAWVEFSAYSDWEEVAQWASNVYAKVPDASSVKKLASDLYAKSQSLEHYIQNVIQFVQEDIRYLGLEFGENTHMPRDPGEVLRTRYGDCKDKSLMISLLLGEYNIKSVPALVNTQARDAISDRQPSPGAFDHVINQVSYGNQTYWVDGTRQYQGSSLKQLAKIDYGFALLVNGEKATLVDMYNPSPLSSTIDIVESFHVKDFESPIEYRVKSQHRGNSADFQRYRFANNSKSKIMEDYLNFYKDLYKDIQSISDITMHDDIENNIFTIEERYTIQFTQKAPDRNFVLPINLASFSDYLPKSKLKDRRLALAIGSPVKVTNTFRIHYPIDVDLSLSQEPVVRETPIYRYEYSDYYKDKIYTHTASLTKKQSLVEPKHLGDYIDGRDKLNNEWYFTLSVPRSDLINGYDKIIALKNRLREMEAQYND